MFLAPLLALLCLGLLGSLRVAAAAQSRVALQSRLDACGVRLAVARESLYGRLTRINAGIRLTVAGITAARAAILVPGAGEAAFATAAALLKANKALALSEDAAAAAAGARELAALRCAPDRWSREPALCLVSPAPPAAFVREATLFPDVAGPLRLRESSLGKVRCAGGAGLETVLALQGDPGLRGGRFRDEYER